MSAALPPLASIRHVPALAGFSNIRATGVLSHDADLALSVGTAPHAILQLQFEPAQGLPYLASIDYGTDPADHIRLVAELRNLHKGALVSAAGDAVTLRSDHGVMALRLVNARDLVMVPAGSQPVWVSVPVPAQLVDGQHALL